MVLLGIKLKREREIIPLLKQRHGDAENMTTRGMLAASSELFGHFTLDLEAVQSFLNWAFETGGREMQLTRERASLNAV